MKKPALDANRQKWNTRFERALKDSPRTMKALDRAIRSGFSRDQIFDDLHKYTQDNPMRQVGVKVLRIKMRKQGKRELDSTIKRLKDFKRLADKLEEVLTLITEYRAEYLKQGTLRGKERDDSIIVRLALQIEDRTGSPAHSDLAYLVTAADHGHGGTGTTDAKDIRQRLKRFETQNPDKFHEIIGDIHSSNPSNFEP
jgi:citrate synthase